MCPSGHEYLALTYSPKVLPTVPRIPSLAAEWIHFALFGIMLPTIKLKVYTFWGL